MAQAQTTYVTPDEYLAMERRAETKSEYIDGQVYAMSGASVAHNLITANLVGELRNRLRRTSCNVCANDQRVKIPSTGLYTYPDVVVFCGEPEFEDEGFDTLLNPTLLIEVLSKSTEDYDQGKKFEGYRSLPSLQEILFVDQYAVHLVHYRRRDDDTWILTETRDAEGSLALPALEVDLPVSEVYLKVDL